MYLRLRGAGIFYRVLNTPERIEVIEKMGHLTPEDADFLRDAATFYRALDHGQRVSTGHAEGSLPTAQAQLEVLTELVKRWTPAHLHEQPSGCDAGRNPPPHARVLQPPVRRRIVIEASRHICRMSRMKLSRFLVSILAVAAVLALYRLVLSVNNTTVALSLLLAVLGVSARWGLAEATVASIVAVLGFNYFFLEPVGTFTIEDPQNWVALVAFLVTAVTASQLSERVRRRAAEAEERRLEIERLYELVQAMMLGGNRAPHHPRVRAARRAGLRLRRRRLLLPPRRRVLPLRSGEQPGDRPRPSGRRRSRRALRGRRRRARATAPVRLGGHPSGSMALLGPLPSDRPCAPSSTWSPSPSRRRAPSKTPAMPRRRARARS